MHRTSRTVRVFKTLGHTATFEYGYRFTCIMLDGKFFHAAKNCCFPTMLDCERFLKAKVQKTAWNQVN